MCAIHIRSLRVSVRDDTFLQGGGGKEVFLGRKQVEITDNCNENTWLVTYVTYIRDSRK